MGFLLSYLMCHGLVYITFRSCSFPETTSAWRVNTMLSAAAPEVPRCILTRGKASRPLHVSSCDRYFYFSRSQCSCRGCVCPYRRACWLPYNIKECECRSCPILHTRMVPPTHTLCIRFCITLSLSCTFLFASHSHSHTAFVLLVLLFFYGFCLVGCFADRLQLDVMARREAGSWVCRLVFRGLLYGESPHSSPTHLPHTPRRDSTHHKGHFPVRAIHLLNVSY